MLSSLSCKMRGHVYGAWQYSPAGAKCHKQRSCERCGAVEAAEEPHAWREWEYAGPAGDEQRRTCASCRAVETRVNVCVPGGWRPAGGEPCQEVQVCTRCGRQLSKRAAHAWAAAEYVEDGNCRRRRTCERCGAQEVLGEEHQWGEWTWVKCRPARMCGRCKKLEYGEAQHSLRYAGADGRSFNPNMGTERWEHYVHTVRYRCDRCGQEVTKEQTHSWEVCDVVRRSDGSIISRRIKCNLCGAEDWEDEIYGKTLGR